VRHRKTGKMFETKLAHTWQIADGKARGLEVHYDISKAQAFLRSIDETF
jgi:ketosteroid isomerase-like protein